MYPSSSLCRAREANDRNRAAGAQLGKVRVIAANAAVAWGPGARATERGAARNTLAQIGARLATLEKLEIPDERDRLFSENPDRGVARP